MNNLSNRIYIEEINTQLKLADLQKNKLIKNIYKEYESYLQLIREVLFFSVEKGIHGLYSNLPMREFSLCKKRILAFFEKEISLFINSQIPLITIEQLKIRKIVKNFNNNKDINDLKEIKDSKDFLIDNFKLEDNYSIKDSSEFHINSYIFNSSEYYQDEINENFVSLDLDNDYSPNYFPNPNTFENIGFEKRFMSSLIELIKDNQEMTSDFEKVNNKKTNISDRYKIIDDFDFIDKSLSNLLVDFSYKINLKLFNENLLKKIISEDSFKYLSNKKFMIKNPHPFVINFDINFNRSLNNRVSLPSLCLFNINTVELEFKNLNLSKKRNKINELKNEFQLLIKKERYWSQKKLNLNKILKKR